MRNQPADVLTDRGPALSDANEPIEHSDSDYEPDPAGDKAGSEREAPYDTLRREPETEVLENNTYPLTAEQEDYPGTMEAIGEVKEYTDECRDLCERTHGLRLLLHKVSYLHLGSLGAKSQRRGLTITFRMVSETRHRSAIALCIRSRLFSDTWIRIARICNGWRDMSRTVRQHYHSSIATSSTA